MAGLSGRVNGHLSEKLSYIILLCLSEFLCQSYLLILLQQPAKTAGSQLLLTALIIKSVVYVMSPLGSSTAFSSPRTTASRME